MSSLKKNSKILLIPNLISKYDLNQLKKIKQTFLKFGIDSHIYNIDYSEENLRNFLKINKFNIIFAVNKSRPNWLSKKIRFINWFQDFYYNSDDKLESFLESDIVYFYASPESFGVKKKPKCFNSMLYPGIDSNQINSIIDDFGNNYRNIDDYQILDFSICGYMPAALLVPFFELHFRNYNYDEKHFNDNLIKGWFTDLTNENEKKYPLETYKNFLVDLQTIVETNYIPLSGYLDVKKIASKVKKRILNMFNFIDTKIFDQIIPFFTTEYSRFLDRIELARLLSKHSTNFGLFGKDWTSYSEFESFSSDHISSEKELFSIYKKTKINLYNNTHGLGMHSKTFEIMVNGGFFALPKSKKNYLKGGINEYFNENEHFVTFSPEKFDDLIENWMFNTEKRIKIGNNARKLVISDHTWDKRIEKILRDLDK